MVNASSRQRPEWLYLAAFGMSMKDTRIGTIFQIILIICRSEVRACVGPWRRRRKDRISSRRLKVLYQIRPRYSRRCIVQYNTLTRTIRTILLSLVTSRKPP